MFGFIANSKSCGCGSFRDFPKMAKFLMYSWRNSSSNSANMNLCILAGIFQALPDSISAVIAFNSPPGTPEIFPTGIAWGISAHFSRIFNRNSQRNLKGLPVRIRRIPKEISWKKNSGLIYAGIHRVYYLYTRRCGLKISQLSARVAW